MNINPNLFVLTGDLGYKMWDQVRESYPDRFYNVGCAEQLLLGAGVGLALRGKLPVCYSITPFLLYRPFEFIRNYLDHEGINVKLVGSGRDRDYAIDGFTHWAEEPFPFKNIKAYYPDSTDELQEHFLEFLYCSQPAYVNLKR